MKFDELQKTGENQQLEFMESFGKETAETVADFSNASGGTFLIGVDIKLLAEAFYLRGDIEKFGTGFFRIQSELKDSPEVSFSLESLNVFTQSGLEVISQDIPQVPQDIPQDKRLAYNTIGQDGLGDRLGYTQNTRQDTAQDTAQVRELIMNVDGEMNREEIQKKLKLTHRENFRKLYLKPALESGLIEMTIPGKPNSKHQKYRLTEKGKRMKNEFNYKNTKPAAKS